MKKFHLHPPVGKIAKTAKIPLFGVIFGNPGKK
jgi:hypothetical protein